MGKLILFVSVTLFTFSLAFASETEVRATLFTDIDAQLRVANTAEANVLAPASYSAGAKLYKSAEELLKKGKNIDRIQLYLDKARIQFEKSIRLSKLAQLTFEGAIKARSDAAVAQASVSANELWASSERTFSLAAKSLESGSINKARKLSAKAEAEYRNTELEAIKNNYLDAARKLIHTANKIKVHRSAPKTLKLAQVLLAKAESSLNKNRYNTDGPQLLAKQALYEAKHAIHISLLVNQLNDEEISAEDLILQSESPLTQVASDLGLVVYFDRGLEEPTQKIQQAVSKLKTWAEK